MHKIDSRTYVGLPGETVTVKIAVQNGQCGVWLDGSPVADWAQFTFTLPQDPGSQRVLQVALFGPLGASAVVVIAVVDGSTDDDVLLCQPHNPAPVNSYGFSVARREAFDALHRMSRL